MKVPIDDRKELWRWWRSRSTGKRSFDRKSPRKNVLKNIVKNATPADCGYDTLCLIPRWQDVSEKSAPSKEGPSMLAYLYVQSRDGEHLLHRAIHEDINEAVLDDSKVVSHKCDNRACCNPDHFEQVNQGGVDGNARKKKRKNIVVDLPCENLELPF